MAEVWVAGATLAVGAYQAYSSAKAGKNAAKAAGDASAAQIAENARQYDQSRTDNMPFLEAGYDALGRQNAVLNGDTSGFENSADYLFRRDQGFRGLNAGLAASGNAGPGGFSGGADADRIALGQGLAGTAIDSYWAKLAGRAGQGQSSAGQLGQLGANYAASNNDAYAAAGAARGSAYANSANAWNNFGSQITGQLGNYAANRPVSYNAFAPNQPGFGSGQLGPSNGSTWNFGP